ncbi:MAG: SDR family NAD(P)-dependent oxidoreductase [Bacteroidales bacterium]
MGLIQKYGKTALVAGASEGIGAAFAKSLAAEGLDLVLVARREEPLNKLAGELESRFNIKTTCILCDLGAVDATEQITEALGGREIDMLVYNAALSYIGPFIENSVEDNAIIAQINMITPLKMLHVFGEKMISRGRGAVVILASLAGFQGSGFLTVYAATKAFDRTLAESLWYEWKDKGVDVIACCAGATSTPGYNNSNPGKSSLFAPRVQAPEEVAEECLKKLGSRPSFISGKGNRIATFFMQKILPRKMAITIMGNTTRKMYGING